ncbi:hypothetical protein QBC46DRAFT_401325 [Diplogelasinospora grovesii]|uniref:Chromo domain-containing protein n=1 Tax=Diplogelasinospora grovesii TaxID=303347 RepID=A0AAN6RYD7_9PEZI|nr:hypothetical protein QBC46DRAFT_401325 [Diplogelasinospora grovesii]
MDNSEGDGILPGEWEGEIIGEESGEYLVAWENSFIPREYASAEMIQAWEAKKAKMRAQKGKNKGSSETKRQGAAVKGRVRVDKTGSTEVKRGRGRPRKV